MRVRIVRVFLRNGLFMAEDQQRELVAFFAFLNTFTLVRPVLAISDLSDGGPFYDVLQLA